MIKPKVLVIDDDADFAELITATAMAMDIPCISSSNANHFFEQLQAEPTMIFLDLLMPEVDGVKLLRHLGEQRCHARIVLVSGVGMDIIEAAEAMAESIGLLVAGHLQKPFQIADLETILRSHLEQHERRMPTKTREELLIDDADLRGAIERDEFVVHYQPQIDLATDRVVGLEALMRWMHPRYGLTYPDHFIPRLESLGWIDELGIILMNHGFSDLGHFADAEEILPSLSLNIPATSICDVTFPDTILLSADKFGVPSANITIEITESGLIEELSKTLYVLTKLRLRNIQLSIDDFGTGYSTMKQLHLVPATELKIDKGFIQTMHLNKGKQVMVRKIIELGHELQMRVVAEGVETPEQLNFLRSSGCDIVQGYLFCRPLPRIELLKWLIRYRSQHHR